MMPMTKKMLKEKKNLGLMTTEEDGMIYIVSRIKNNSYNPDKMILLSPDHPCTKLILKSFHDVSCLGVSGVLMLWYWIPQQQR